MKVICTVTTTVLFIALTVLGVNARKINPAPAVQTSVADNRFAIVDSEAFAESKTGVTRLASAFEAIDREMKPKRDELQQLQTRYATLAKELSDTKTSADQSALKAKTEQAESLQLEIKRKQEDGQNELEKRVKQLTEPIYADISNALMAYGKQRGIGVIVDISKFRGSMMVVNDQVDITDAFIADYNSKNATSAPSTAPMKP